jgi:hypothetical protein
MPDASLGQMDSMANVLSFFLAVANVIFDKIIIRKKSEKKESCLYFELYSF